MRERIEQKNDDEEIERIERPAEEAGKNRMTRAGIFGGVRWIDRRAVRWKFFCGRFRHSSWQEEPWRRALDERLVRVDCL